MGKAKAFPICKSEVTGMKRAALLMLVQLLLTACGAPAAEPTPDAAPPGRRRRQSPTGIHIRLAHEHIRQ